MSHIPEFFSHAMKICAEISYDKIEELVWGIDKVRKYNGRLFLIGVGGSAANCSHAVNDFRKICGIEAYAPTDNISEITARTNDDGWETVFSSWLDTSHIGYGDALMVLSVGGGDVEKNISINIVKAIDVARQRGAKVFGIVGRAEGYTAKHGDIVVVIPQPSSDLVTPLSESFQALVWHSLATHPQLANKKTKLEAVT